MQFIARFLMRLILMIDKHLLLRGDTLKMKTEPTISVASKEQTLLKM